MSKCKILKDLLNSRDLEFAMECHNGMSSKIVQNAGFKIGWLSGLSLSASLGVRDRNELSFKEVADMAYYVTSRVNIPILLDMDTGYGDYNTASVAVKMLESAGVAGICIEDKLFPKQNSFLKNSKKDLEDPEIQAGKIRAIRDSVNDPDFVIVARLESFIAGSTLDDAYNRALVYQAAGANAILVHSKKPNSIDIDNFMERWNSDKCNGLRRIPIVIVPTKYYTTPTDHFRDLGISLVIWANHNLRASIKSMMEVSTKIYREQSLYSVEDTIVSVRKVFELQGDDELVDSEKKYLNTTSKNTKALILAGGLVNGTKIPKASIKVLNKSIFNYQVDTFEDNGIEDIRTVVGNYWDTSTLRGISHIYHNYADTKEIGSISSAINNGYEFDNCIISFGDLFFKKGIVSDLLNSDTDLTVVVSNELYNTRYTEYVNPYSSNISFFTYSKGESIPSTVCSNVGVIKIKNSHATNDIKDFLTTVDVSTARLKDLLNYLISKHYSIDFVHIDKNNWVDVNEIVDIAEVSNVIGG